MGATVIDPSIVVNGGAGKLSAVSPIGAGVGSVFVTVALIYVLVYFDLADAAETNLDYIKRMLLASILPLTLVFISIIAFEVTRVTVGF